MSNNSKELFLKEALKLFAEKGYEAVSVAEIGEAMGFSAPALYKHYKSKQSLFDALLEKGKLGFEETMQKFNLDFQFNSGKIKDFVLLPEEDQVQVVKQYFSFAITDEYAVLFRKLLTVEQFHNPALADIYNQRYIETQLDSMEILIKEFIKAGVMKNENAHTMALQFISPISMYIGICDRTPQKKEEALVAIEAHIRQFFRVYKI